MDSLDLIIRSSRVVTPEIIRPASVHIRNGVIVTLSEWDEISSQTALVDAGDAVLMTGLVDSHVHVNEPGRTRWEGFATATRAAAAGGITTLVDMPLNSIPPTTTITGFQEKLTHNSTLKFYRFAIAQKLTLYKPLRQARTPAKRKLTSFFGHICHPLRRTLLAH